MHINSDPTSTAPLLNADGTISAVVLGRHNLTIDSRLTSLWLPDDVSLAAAGGQFLMARCCHDDPVARVTDWSLYLRRPLYVAGPSAPGPKGVGSQVLVWSEASSAPGDRWLAQLPEGAKLNLLGPFGLPFSLPVHTRTLLVLAKPITLPVWLPAVHAMLDRGGRVTVIMAGENPTQALVPFLPLPVEVLSAPDEDTLARQLGSALRWADLLCVGLGLASLQLIADMVRRARFRMEPGFAHAHVLSDLACGFGGCLACAIPLPNGGTTRACVHGPIMPLERLTR
jgi:hypothetical protein